MFSDNVSCRRFCEDWGLAEMARVMQKTTSYRSGETVGNVFSLYNQYLASSSLPMVGRKLTSHFGEFPKLKGGFEGRTMTKQPKTQIIAYHKTEKRSALCSMVSPPPSVGDRLKAATPMRVKVDGSGTVREKTTPTLLLPPW